MAEVTYADLKFMTVERPRNQEPHEAKAKESPTPSPYWRLTAVILGIFCFGLLVTAGVLSVKFIQVSHLVSEWHENLTQKREILGNLTQQLEFLQAQNLNLSETVQQLASYRAEWRRNPGDGAQTQIYRNIGPDPFLVFPVLTGRGRDMIQSSAYVSIQGFIIRSAQSYSSYSFWIALSRKGADGSWLWEDGRAFSTDLFRIPEASSSLYPICVSIQGANVNAVECGSYKFCICEKVANSVGTA
ncbi:oxidized low-density lipoprotein receptor 1-like [Mauremys reevesii]|uniref:oxidized low-density lipoprotein receptor 1-like n=1 Tax=Mauremys reevesii TaxID=260615 RepID=UPI00193ECB27|nr:oxidized low-density lipoprotein receptor 1-like [Mauremys reevesii]